MLTTVSKMTMTTARILVWFLSCFPFIANGCLVLAPDGFLYVDTFQLLEDPNFMLLNITAYNIPTFEPYCKILDVNDGTVSDVVSCDQNTREWASDIDPSNTSIASATDNHDGTADVVLSRNGATVVISGVSYAQSQPYTNGTSSQIYCNQFTLSSVYTTFVGLNRYSYNGNPEIIRITFESATDNTHHQDSVIMNGSSSYLWMVDAATNRIPVYEDVHAIELWDVYGPFSCEGTGSRLIARYDLQYTSGVISGIQIDIKVAGGKVDPLAEKAYRLGSSIRVYDLSMIGGASNYYVLDLNYTTASTMATNIQSLSPTYPSTNPTTSSPTKPRLLCGGDNVGTYTEGQITFDVTMPYDGELI
eukprot:931970_1